VRYLNERGMEAIAFETRFKDEGEEEEDTESVQPAQQ
jgi:hypothetical protein